MAKKDTGDFAFPFSETVNSTTHPGMTLRDWFAGQALVIAHADYQKGIPDHMLRAMFGGRNGLHREEIIAALAGQYADAMLAERSKP